MTWGLDIQKDKIMHTIRNTWKTEKKYLVYHAWIVIITNMDYNRTAYNFASTHNTSMILHTQMHALGLHGNLHAAFTFLAFWHSFIICFSQSSHWDANQPKPRGYCTKMRICTQLLLSALVPSLLVIMSGCTFQHRWLEEPNFKDWRARDPDIRKANCRVCRKSFVLTKGTKH